MMRIDVFFKKKNYNNLFTPGGRSKEGKGDGLGWVYLQGTLEEVEVKGRGGCHGGKRFSYPKPLSFLLFPPHNQLKSS
jgi:hypothetical protein